MAITPWPATPWRLGAPLGAPEKAPHPPAARRLGRQAEAAAASGRSSSEGPPSHGASWRRDPAGLLPGLVHRGGQALEARPPTRLGTGVAALDALLAGGFPRGCLSEVAGPLSSGRTSLALALLAATTRAGGPTAFVDAADAFDPESAAAAGADLDQVLWVRPTRARTALRCAERLLEARGFALVVLDGMTSRDGIAPAAWLRLARAAAAAGAAFVVCGPERLSGTAAALAVELRPGRACFAARPEWLEGLDASAVLVRHRFGPALGAATIPWKVSPDARGLPAGSGSPRRSGAAGQP